MSIYGFQKFITNSRNRKVIIRAVGIVSTAGIASYYWPELSFMGRTFRRAARTTVFVTLVSLDYKRNFPSLDRREELGDEVWREKRNEVHLRAARRLLRLFQLNSGIYIKVGQHLSALEYVLPPEFCQEMAILHSQAPKSSLSEVYSVIFDELGVPPVEFFSQFDEEPIGAASLAQVHRAIKKDTGEEVAVKVQHQKLKDFIDSDLFVISTAVKVVKWVFPEFDLDWIAEEMKLNLPKELDFVNEGHNSERLLRNFRIFGGTPLQGGGNIVRVPKIHWDLTSKRVLTMEYLPGFKATDVKNIESFEIDCKQVSSLITRVFSEMIFIHGFFHCDPHPGNLLIRPRQENKSQWRPPWRRSTPFELVILDHGLYREIPDGFRRNYAGLWMAVIEANEPKMREYAELVGGGEAYRLFSCILTQRSWKSVCSGSILKPKSVAEMEEIKAKAPEYLAKVADLLAKVPRPLLLLLKTNDLLRHLERKLVGGSTSRTFTIMAHYCLDALYEDQRIRNSNSSGIILTRINSFVYFLRYLWNWTKISILDFILTLKITKTSLGNLYNI